MILTTAEPSIEHYEAADGRRLAVRRWKTPAPPCVRAIFLHGVTSHGGWYDRSCCYLARQGIEVHFLDRRGSGLNSEHRGDVDRWTTWLDDVTRYVDKLRSEQPVVLCGISWGGKLAAAVGRMNPGAFAGIALICPGLYSYFEPGIVKRLALAVPLPARVNEQRVAIPLAHPKLFTDTAEWQEFIARDSLALRQITVRFAREDRRLSRFARKAGPALKLPLLLMLAGHDRIVHNRRTLTFFHSTAAANRTLIEYPQSAHTLEFEPDPTQYIHDLSKWINDAAESTAG